MFEIKQQQQQQQKQGPAVGIRSYDVAALFPSQPSTNAVAGTSSTLAVAGTSGDPPTKEKGKKNTQQLEKVKENAEKIIDLSTITNKEKIPINKC